MASEPDASGNGAGVGPSTPAARRHGRPPSDDIGPELSALEESAASEPALLRPGDEQAPAPAAPAEQPAAPAEQTAAPPVAQPAGPAGPPPAAPPPPRPAPPRRAAPGERPTSPVGRDDRPGPPPPGPPHSVRDRSAALLALGLGAGAVLIVATSLMSSGSPAASIAGFDAQVSRNVVAPGGWLAVRGSDAPPDTEVVLETRARGSDWREAGRVSSDGDGDYRVSGRALASPGPLAVRARAPGGSATSEPVSVSVRPLRLASVGDINLGDVPGAAIAANGPRYPWESVGPALRNADIAFGNLECAVSKRGEPFPKQFNFRGTPRALRGLRRNSGLDVLNLANNHVGDYGPQAMMDTVRGVERMDMKAVGAGQNLDRALEPQVVERLGLRVAFVGFSEIYPIEFAAAADRPGTAWAEPDSIARAVRAAHKRADVVVATFHWGIEKAGLESAAQQTLARAAVDAGAQLVIGAHPHVLQPLRREGAGLVAYSLGNFVFGAASSDTTSTGILVTDLTGDGVSGARWRPGQIAGGRPEMDRSRPRRLPLGDPAAMSAGVTL